MQEKLNEGNKVFLKNIGIDSFNPMQEEVFKKATEVNNLMLLAPTGSGKTLAFLIPLIHKLNPDINEVQAVVLAPSRELALQIEQVFRSLKTNYKVSCCYGGHSVKIEQNSLSDAPAVIIATPGRLADHLERESFDPSHIKFVVLDEFDKSLQMGFHAQIRILFEALDGKQQHFLTSATDLDPLPDFLPFKQVERLNYLKEKSESKLELKLVRTKTTEKVESLLNLISCFNQEVCLIFCNHREAVERISLLLSKNDFEHGIFHGGMEQIDREKNLIKFRGGAHNVLISTDLAARGLDIPEIRHVVHYQLPPKEEEFVHRNGRTARMHAEGKAYLILAEDESLPEYLNKPMVEIALDKNIPLPPPPEYACLYISGGKKDKISKGDIAGFLMKKAGLNNNEVGLITTLDHASYVCIKRHLVNKVLRSTKDEKIKKMKVKIALAR